MREAIAQFDLFVPQVSLAAEVPQEVRELFEHLALTVIERGWVRYSADAVLHKIRWEMQIERGNRDFKVNDHWSAPLARWFIARHPDHKLFFELRALAHERKYPV